MRKIFIAVAKVFGLLQVYYGLAYTISIIPLLGMITRVANDTSGQMAATNLSGESLPSTVIGIVAMLILTFGVAWLLLFRTGWLADKLQIPEESNSDGFNKDTIILTGIILIGLHVTIKAAPAFTAACFHRGGYNLWALSAMLSPALRLCFGLVLAIRPHFVLRLLAIGEKTPGIKIIMGGLAIAAILIIFGWSLARRPWLPSQTQYSFEPAHHTYSKGSPATGEEDTNLISAEEWFREPHGDAGTNAIPLRKNANTPDTTFYITEETDRTERIAAPLPLEGPPSDVW